MRLFIIILFVLPFNLLHAQPGGGMRGGRPQGNQGGIQDNRGQQRPEIPEFNAAKVVGIFNYDVQEVIKKIKPNKNDGIALKVKHSLNKYNNEINNIALLNQDNFDTLNVFVNSTMKALRPNSKEVGSNQGRSRGEEDNNDNNPMKKIRGLTREKLKPARIAIRKVEEELNISLKELLDEKQYKKWLKYQEKVKEELKPQNKPKYDDNNNRMSRSRQGAGVPRGGMR